MTEESTPAKFKLTFPALTADPEKLNFPDPNLIRS